MAESEQSDLTTLTVQLLSAYVSNNQVASEDLAKLISTTREALGGKSEPETPATPEYEPAVSARKSLGSREHIISMIDGKPYLTLKRHLSKHGLTPAEYRARYKLPETYPMVAPAYSEKRRDVARKLGLGRKPANAAANAPATLETNAAAPQAAAPPVATPATPATKPARTAKGAAKASGASKAPKAAASKVAAAKPDAAVKEKAKAATPKSSASGGAKRAAKAPVAAEAGDGDAARKVTKPRRARAEKKPDDAAAAPSEA